MLYEVITNEYPFAPKVGKALFQVDGDGRAAQKVLGVYFAGLNEVRRSLVV